MNTITNDPTTLILFVSLLVGILSLSVGLRKFQETGAFFVLTSDRWKTEKAGMEKMYAEKLEEVKDTIRTGFQEQREHLATKADLEAVKGRLGILESAKPSGFFSEVPTSVDRWES